MTTNQILVQNIETFETVTRLTVGIEVGETVSDRVDQYFSNNNKWGIVSLDDDADGEYMAVLLVAPIDGPDFEFDAVTGEMEPVDNTMNDASQEEILAAIDAEALLEEAKTDAEAGRFAASIGKRMIARDIKKGTITAKPRKQDESKTKSRTKAKGAKMSTQPKQRNFEILSSHIESNPGVSRTDVFADAGLQSALRTKAQVAAIAKGDKAEVKRWNRRLNFLIREMRRQGVDIQIERKGRIAHYTIGKPSGQLELPFDDAAVERNSAITGTDLEADVPVDKPKVDPKRAEEESNQMVDFEALLATLDEEAVAPVQK